MLKEIRFKNKKAISLMVSYVIIIAIGIGISIAVYSWLKYYPNIIAEKKDCNPETAMVVEDYDCTRNVLNLTIRNNGFFNIEGVVLTVGNDSGIDPIILLEAMSLPSGSFGYYTFASPLAPGEVANAEFNMEDSMSGLYQQNILIIQT